MPWHSGPASGPFCVRRQHDETCEHARVRIGASVARNSAERFLCPIGIDADLIEAAVGDITEEYVDRADRDGTRAARLWCVREVVRSVPHVILTALRQGSPRTRFRLIACLATMLLPFAVTAAVIALRDGPPARLVASVADASEGVVLNTMRPVQLQMRALDKRGHVLNRATCAIDGRPAPRSRSRPRESFSVWSAATLSSPLRSPTSRRTSTCVEAGDRNARELVDRLHDRRSAA